ncbi:hypothetical protein EG68_02648 [Paragonimus skrjabini miyazakii]|uniref:J domain-containing protein n=1 Tax=Paragonimus skrjabini miyazakii TaxID=59628 RepID=A0A8S9Z7W3_9TREM|nr:hypothetical protein EG68_02648 [Paragonimus skrjabini miyazakii]
MDSDFFDYLTTPCSHLTSYYDLLGVDPDSSIEQIETEFRLKAREFHPDKNMCTDSTTIFQNLTRAREVLTDPQLRKNYDTWLASGIHIPFDKWLAMKNQFHTCMHWSMASGTPQKMLLMDAADCQSNRASRSCGSSKTEASASNLLNLFRAYKI